MSQVVLPSCTQYYMPVDTLKIYLTGVEDTHVSSNRGRGYSYLLFYPIEGE